MQRGGIKSIFAIFFPVPYSTTCLPHRFCVEFVMASVSEKIILITVEYYDVCISVIDAGQRLGGVWQAVVLFEIHCAWDSFTC